MHLYKTLVLTWFSNGVLLYWLAESKLNQSIIKWPWPITEHCIWLPHMVFNAERIWVASWIEVSKPSRLWRPGIARLTFKYRFSFHQCQELGHPASKQNCDSVIPWQTMIVHQCDRQTILGSMCRNYTVRYCWFCQCWTTTPNPCMCCTALYIK